MEQSASRSAIKASGSADVLLGERDCSISATSGYYPACRIDKRHNPDARRRDHHLYQPWVPRLAPRPNAKPSSQRMSNTIAIGHRT